MGILQTMPVEVRSKYTFTEKEKQQIGAELSGKIERLDGLESEKKAVMSDFKEKIDNAESEVKRLASNINLGYEYRSYTCRIVRDLKLKIKKYYCVHSGKLIQTKEFDPQDFQITFDDKARVKQPIAKMPLAKVEYTPGTALPGEPAPTLTRGIDVKTAAQLKKEKSKKLEDAGTKILKKNGLNKKAEPKNA